MRRSAVPLLLAALCAALTSSHAIADAPKNVPGQWVTYIAPAIKPRAPDLKMTVFVPERAPEKGERIPSKSGATAVLKCAAPWQLIKPKSLGARGAWAPSPSGDGKWVWHPKKAPAATTPTPMPEAEPDYEGEFFFCAQSPDEPWTVKSSGGKTVPGSWVMLVDGKRSTTLFVANTIAGEGDVLPDIPKQVRRIECRMRNHPGKGNDAALDFGKTRPTSPFGRWVADPFGSKRWAWVPSAPAPLSLRPVPSPPSPPEVPRKRCSWFDDAD